MSALSRQRRAQAQVQHREDTLQPDNAPTLADPALMEAIRTVVDAAVSQTRRAALAEAARLICWRCARAAAAPHALHLRSESLGGVWQHVERMPVPGNTYRLTVVRCAAGKVWEAIRDQREHEAGRG